MILKEYDEFKISKIDAKEFIKFSEIIKDKSPRCYLETKGMLRGIVLQIESREKNKD
ncbi:hypothetical protein ACWTV9_14225 [Clostridioides difficile]